MVLSLNKRESLVKKRKRVGRGGSRGGTAGRGMKGQKCRSGGSIPVHFEGGQMPLTRRLPKHGFSNARFAKEWVVINLGRLNEMFDDGQEVNRALLIERGVIGSKSAALIKILGNGALTKRLIIEADAASKSALESIKKQGGEVRLIGER